MNGEAEPDLVKDDVAEDKVVQCGRSTGKGRREEVAALGEEFCARHVRRENGIGGEKSVVKKEGLEVDGREEQEEGKGSGDGAEETVGGETRVVEKEGVKVEGREEKVYRKRKRVKSEDVELGREVVAGGRALRERKARPSYAWPEDFDDDEDGGGSKRKGRGKGVGKRKVKAEETDEKVVGEGEGRGGENGDCQGETGGKQVEESKGKPSAEQTGNQGEEGDGGQGGPEKKAGGKPVRERKVKENGDQGGGEGASETKRKIPLDANGKRNMELVIAFLLLRAFLLNFLLVFVVVIVVHFLV